MDPEGLEEAQRAGYIPQWISPMDGGELLRWLVGGWEAERASAGRQLLFHKYVELHGSLDRNFSSSTE